MQLMATQGLAQEPVEWESVEAQAQGLLSAEQFSLLSAMMQDSRSTVQVYNMLVQSSDAPLLGFKYSVAY